MQVDQDERVTLDRNNPNIWHGAKCPRCGGAITKMMRPVTVSFPTPKAEGDRRVTRIVDEYGPNKGKTVVEYEHTIVAYCKPCSLAFTMEGLRRLGNCGRS